MSQESKAIAAETPRDTSSAVLADWMKFPTLAEVFDHSPSKTIADLTAKHKHYKSLEAISTAADRVRARLISVSYARTCELLQELETAQIELNKKQATKSENRR
jgi:hypothetical protein